MRLFLKYDFYIVIRISALLSCTGKPRGDISKTGNLPAIDPDYTGITIPYNIAPLNFKILEEGNAFFARFSSGSETYIETGSKDGIIRIPEGKWKRMLEENKDNDLNIQIYSRNKDIWSEYKTITNVIAAEPVDPFI